MNYQGDYKEDATVLITFNTFTSNDPSASSTITNFANTDVHIHKDDDLTQRNNAAGITVSVNFDGITGSHMIKIDTNDNTVAGFWVTGKDYFVRIEGTSVDGATINAVVGHFSIENRHNEVDLTHIMGTILTEGVDGRLAAALIKLLDVATPVLTAESVNQSANNNTILAHGTYGNSALQVLIAALQTDLDNGTDGLGALKTLIDTVDNIADRILDATEIRQAAIADVAATTTKFDTNLTEVTNDYWNRMAILFTSGQNDGQMRRIKDYDGTAKEITLQTPLSFAPANADTFIICTVRAFVTPDIEDIADQMCDELLAGHTIAGSLAKKIGDQTNPPSQTLNDYKATGFSTHNAAAVKAAIEAVGSHLALIKAQTDLVTAARMGALTDWINGGRLDLILDIIATDTTTDIPALIATLNNLSAANVNAEIVDVLKTDTKGEPAQGAPGTTLSIEDKIAYIYKFLRNKIWTTSTGINIYNDAGDAVDHKSTISDDGTTFKRGEFGSGP